jgi:hypothetical protein
MFVTYQIKQLGKVIADQTKTHEQAETPKTISEKRPDDSAPMEAPPIKKKTNQDMIICPQCHEKNPLINRNISSRRCSFCDFNIKKPFQKSDLNYQIPVASEQGV